MRPPYQVPLWKQAPIMRLLFPLIAGIIIGWYGQFSLVYIVTCICCFSVAFLLINFLSSAIVFRFRKFRGIVFHFIIIALGMLLVWQKDARHQHDWYGHFLTDSSLLLVTINEPPVVKPRSVKAEALVNTVINGEKQYAASGKLLFYFSQDSVMDLKYGDVIIINKRLQPITNSGNPGAFNYKRYAAFQLLYHQAFLKKADWAATNRYSINYFRQFLFDARGYVLSVLKKYICNNNNELGIAEALLIGYKEDLDKDLVQAYSNTGVVHIIAISGLHLGLIYTVLLWLFDRMPYLKKSRHAKAVLLITCLWLFALLTGAAASVLRSAVMFTIIVTGKYYFRRSPVYNSLAASAFILLCYNPYLLWDVGFQLSYCAVIGIVALQPFIYRKWFIANWPGRQVWAMTSVTLAAQVGAFPLCIYYFHQFPNLFLITNLVTVPLSTVILFGEILLIIIAVFYTIAGWLGVAISYAIDGMNRLIIYFNSFWFSVWDHIYATIFTTWFLYACLFCTMGWWMNKNKRMLIAGLCCLVVFVALHGLAFIRLQNQQKVIIYNISRHRAVDFIDRNQFVFAGDSSLMKEGLQQNFHLKPARIALQASRPVENIPSLQQQNGYYQFCNKKLLFIDSSAILSTPDSAIEIDLLLFSYNPPVDIKEVIKAVKPACIVFDASNSLWKIQKWKRDCEALILRCHSVPEEGAFILEVDRP